MISSTEVRIDIRLLKNSSFCLQTKYLSTGFDLSSNIECYNLKENERKSNNEPIGSFSSLSLFLGVLAAGKT